MPVQSFAKDVKIVPILSYASANSDRTSEVIDTLGFDKCTIVVHFATIATNAVTQMYLAHADAASDQNTLTSGANVATSAQSIADNDDNNVKYMEFIPTKRYYQLTMDKDATNACAESAIAYLYRAEKVPVTQATGNTTIGEGTGAVAGEVVGVATSGTI